MLINFTVKNFKSFNGELILNLSAAKRFRLDYTLPAEAYRLNILPISGIYGAKSLKNMPPFRFHSSLTAAQGNRNLLLSQYCLSTIKT